MTSQRSAVLLDAQRVLAHTDGLLDAQNDIEAVSAWLKARASNSPETFRRYSLQAQRLLAFLELRQERLDDMNLASVHAYAEAIRRGEITGKPMDERYIDNAFVVLKSMVKTLVEAGYLQRNVLALRARKTPEHKDVGLERFLDNQQLDAVLCEAASLNTASDKTTERLRAHRIRFTLIWMLMTTSRVSSLCHARMTDVYARRVGNEREWFWQARLKGRKIIEVPVRDEAMDALRQYRQANGLSEYPDQNDPSEGFLIQRIVRQKKTPLDRSAIFRELKQFFDCASDRLADPQSAEHLRQASGHWLRHTAAVQLLDSGASMRFVSKLLGHASIQTTSSVYDHIERAEWRREINKGRAFHLSDEP